MLFRFLATLQFLTRLPVPLPRAPTADELPAMLPWYPVVGLVLGAAGLGTGLGLHALAPHAALLSGVAVLTVWVVLTGAFHLDGLADTFDGLLSGRRGAEAGAIMKDSRTGAMGAVALGVLLLAKGAALGDVVARELWWALLVAPAAGRWCAVLLAWRGRSPAWCTSGIGTLLAGRIGTGAVLLTTLVVVGPAMGLAGSPLAVVPVLAAGAAAAFILLRARAVIGGITGDVLGAAIEVGETVFLAAAALAPAA